MQLKQVADLLGVDNKEVVKEVESRRDAFTEKGFKIAKKLNASSSLDEDLVRHILANFDLRRQQIAEEEKVAEKKRHREEEDRQRMAADIQRKKEEEERSARAEVARQHAEAELARKQAEVRAQEEVARRAFAEKAAQEAAAAEAAAQAKAAESAKPAPAQASAAPTAQQPTAPSPPAPGITPAPQTVQRPGSMPPRAPQSRPGGYQGNREGGQPRPPQSGGYQGREGGGGYQPREGAPRPPGAYPPREGARPPQGGYQGREGAPRPQGGYQGREGAPRPQGGYPPRENRPPGSYPPRDASGRPPYGGGPGGGPRGPRPAGPGGPQQRYGPPGGRPGEGRTGADGKPARAADLQSFVNRGIETDVTDDFKRAQARRTKPAKPTTTPAVQDREKKKGPKVDDKKRIRPSQIFNPDAVSGDRRPRSRKKGHGGRRYDSAPSKAEPKIARFAGDFTVGEFADRTGIALSEVMKKLFLVGEMLTINQILEPDKAEMLALEFNVDISIERESDENDVLKYIEAEDAEETLLPRPPVVTIMGHVDHGKTSLLDRIRKADVAAGEFGGITQHIGAYLVATEKGDVAFLDTPGHEAFTEMRSRGANVTDLVVLVVAANDGVMPQTVEAINHAKAAGVEILVAINKMDVPGANPERVKQEMMKYEMVPEEYGGSTIMIPVSAATGEGVDTLLEYIALQTEVLELKANPDRAAEGTVVESHVDPLRGAVATILVGRGTLKVGDAFLCGTEYGRVRAMRDDRDHMVDSAAPSHPVEIIGLSGSPVAGEKFIVMPSESEAREIAERRQARRKNRKAIVKTHISLDNLADRMTEGDTLTLNLIIKGDVQGSIEAIASSLLKIKSDKVQVKILHSAVGAVSLSDVQLADASEAIILSFNVGTDPTARTQAEELGVDIRSYNIIYALLEDIQKAMLGMLQPEFEEKSEGRAIVQQTFKVSKVGTVAGCLVQEGAVAISHQARLLRGGTIIWRGKLRSLRRVKEDARQVLSGVECGIGLENYNDVKEGDIIETFSLVQKTASLMAQ